jgi:hypothetical protein
MGLGLGTKYIKNVQKEEEGYEKGRDEVWR